MQLLYFLPTIFWIWMIVECLRYDPERNLWIWLLIFLNFPGAVIYFLIRRLPTMDLPISHHFQRQLRKKEIWNAEAAALNIGNAYQFEVLGDLKLDLGSLEEAKEAYQKALAKEPNNLKVLWGIIQINTRNKNFTEAKNYLEKLLKIKPDYEYGEASLLYIKTLLELAEQDRVKTLLEENIKIWNKPEAHILLAEIYIQESQSELAKEHLQKMLFNLRSSPSFFYKRHRHLERKANKLLKKV